MSKFQTPIKKDIVDELHKPARRNFKRRRVIVKGLFDLHQADLVEMIPYERVNKRYRYILVVIEPVKRKAQKPIADAMEKILDRMKRKPKNLQTDSGGEFFNETFGKMMKKHGINHYSTYSGIKASIAERVNRTIKSKIWKEFSLQGSYKWLPILQRVVDQYNNTKHRTIHMKPSEVNKRQEKNLLNTVYNNIKTVKLKNIKFKVGDKVRISKFRHIFDKGYTPNWTNEIFTVAKIKLTNPVTFLLKDENNQPIKGAFYIEELQKVKHPGIYLVEKVIRRNKDMVFVKWLGFDNSHNSWIRKSNVM